MTSSRRTGATSRAKIPPAVLRQLNQGEVETKTLAEGLAVDFVKLVKACDFGRTYPHARQELSFDVGIKQRMQRVGEWLWAEFGAEGIHKYVNHPADTVRGWVAYAIAAQPGMSTIELLKQIRPLADDTHFGVREWAWIAVRGRLAEEIEDSLKLLQPWTTQHAANLRRFAIEVTRPRGVWCAHIAELKEHPELALPLLTAVNADPEKYVQDSVANWLNDASKTQPAWVHQVCDDWRTTSPTPATDRICHRALRSLR